MAQFILCNKLLNSQQDEFSSFTELLEEISQNSQQVQSFIDQCSSTMPKSILGRWRI